MLLLGFVFLLRPGEYAYTDDEATPFCLNDLQILIHNRCLHPTQCSEADLHSVNYVALEFTNQKNGVHSELVGLGRSGHLIHCPVQALINWVKHLRATCAPLTTTLYSYYDTQWRRIDTTTLTQHLHHTVMAIGHHFGIHQSQISIRSL
jgi:hypothetical protein